MTALPPLLLASNSAWNLAHFRKPLIESLLGEGFRIFAAVPAGDDTEPLRTLGVEIKPVAVDRSGMSPISDLRLLADYVRVMREVRPAAFLGFTAKPNIYGSVAARLCRVPAINNISGLGTGFLSGGALERIMTLLYRLALNRSKIVFFQNEDDRRLFEALGLARVDQARMLAGSGVDLRHFAPAEGQRRAGPRRFLLVARMLRDKGVGEFVEAARTLRSMGVPAEFSLLGPAGDDNRSAISPAQLAAWTDEGAVTWRGASSDVRAAMADADVVVLPSYREGMPRTLLEAAAMGKAVVATDVPGCRQAVVDGITGSLCKARDHVALSHSMRFLAEMPLNRLEVMGRENRQRAEREFGDDRIVAAYREALAACGIATGH